MAKTFGVISLKGGVGKTTVVVALGEAISQLGKKVLIVDGNLSAPNLSMHLKSPQFSKTLHDVLGNFANPSEAVYSCGAVDFLPSNLFNENRINPLKLRNKIRHLKRAYDMIILDSSPSLGDETMAVMIASDELIVVATPDHPTLATTLKAVKFAKQRETPITGIILNKVYDKGFEIDLDYIEKYTDVPVIALIPHDINVMKSLSFLSPITEYKPKSRISKEFLKLAQTISGEKKNRQSNLKRWFSRTPKRPDINREIYYRRVFG